MARPASDPRLTVEKVRHLTAEDLELSETAVQEPKTQVLTRDEVTKLRAEYQRFRAQDPYAEWTTNFRSAHESYSVWLKGSGILPGSPPPDELVDQALRVANAYSGTDSALKIFFPRRVMADNNLTKADLAAKLGDYFFSSDDLPARLKRFIELKDIGPHVATHLLSAHDPTKYPIYSPYHTESLARILGTSSAALLRRVEEKWGVELGGGDLAEVREPILWMKLLDEVRRSLP